MGEAQYAEDPIKVFGSDASTFVTINPEVADDHYHVAFGKDKNFVFRMTTVLPGADPSSFVAEVPNNDLYNNFSKDGHHVYFQSSVLENMDPTTFVVIDEGSEKDCGYGPYIKDKNGIYTENAESQFNFHKIEGVDEATFEVIGMGFSRDKNHVYAGALVRSDLDPKTFKPECGIG